MLNDQPDAGQPELRSLTHSACLVTGSRLVERGADGRPWVQVRRFHPDGSYVLCGQMAELIVASDGGELFKVNTTDGAVCVTGRNVRLCSGTGRCTCEPGQAEEVAPC